MTTSVGFDLGNASCLIAVAKSDGIHVLMDDDGNLQIPAVVSFGDNERFFGSKAAPFATKNPQATISQIKRLVGRSFDDQSVKADLQLFPFATHKGPRGEILIEVESMAAKWSFTPVQILAMLFKHLKLVCEKNISSEVLKCVVGIPAYFTDLQRRLYLDAATVAGLRHVSLLHEGTAIALEYGLKKLSLSFTGSKYVLFLDIGQSDTQVTVAAFQQGKLEILCHEFEQSLGGRDFDAILYQHFARQLKRNFKFDVGEIASSSAQLRASCEKTKTQLSAKTDVMFTLKRFLKDQDVGCVLTRDKFDQSTSHLVQRVTNLCSKALRVSGLSIERIDNIELVGCGSRIPAITRAISTVFNKEPKRTLDVRESVARGCALHGSELNYEVNESFPYLIAVRTKDGTSHVPRRILFPRGSPFPRSMHISHTGSSSSILEISYSNLKDFPVFGVSPLIGSFKMNLPFTAQKVTLNVPVLLNRHGIIEVKPATVTIASESEVVSSQRIVAFSKNLIVSTTEEELSASKAREKTLSERDENMQQRKIQRSKLESCVHETRVKFLNGYKRFASLLENEEINKCLEEIEEWLDEQDDDVSTQEEYTKKFDDIQKLLEPVERKFLADKRRADKRRGGLLRLCC